jgi:hypothetical protein
MVFPGLPPASRAENPQSMPGESLPNAGERHRMSLPRRLGHACLQGPEPPSNTIFNPSDEPVATIPVYPNGNRALTLPAGVPIRLGRWAERRFCSPSPPPLAPSVMVRGLAHMQIGPRSRGEHGPCAYHGQPRRRQPGRLCPLKTHRGPPTRGYLMLMGPEIDVPSFSVAVTV